MRLNQDNFRIENRTSRAHPGTEDCTVCRRLMLGMVPSMFGRLNLGQASDEKNADYKSDC
jgi:hypothetical protein